MDDHAAATTDAAPASVVEPTLAPGALIAGRYRLEARLGAGGGGTVWRCRDEKLAMPVALKVIGSEGELERWRREVAMARRIADRNVCRVHDLGEAEGLRYVTMEIVEGKGLRAVIADGVAIERARDLFTQIVSGVAAIHAAGVVHRDLKPDNIVVATDGRAVIVDFGLAREPGAKEAARGDASTVDLETPATLTREGAIVGTPRYMSPEQAAGDAVDMRADVWALGLIGYELVTGKLPQQAERGRTVDPAALAAWPALTPVLRKCLAVDPAERYQDARELRDAIAARPRRRGLLVGAAVLGLAGIAGAAVLAINNEPAQIAAVEDARAVIPSDAAPLAPVTPVKLVSPAFSVAISPDAKEYAYTTASGQLFVAPLAGGPPREWPLPAIEKSKLVTTFASGWFSDRSIVITGLADTGVWHLVRVYEDGRKTLLYSTTDRFTAHAAGDVAAIGLHENAVYVVHANKPDDLEQIERIGRDELVMALAVSPDGSRVAVARLPPGGEKAEIQVITLQGGDVRRIWSGEVVNDVDQMIGWLDEDRVVFGHRREKSTTLHTFDLRNGQLQQRYEWPAGVYAGIASAARGELLFVGGRLAHGVAIGGARAEQLEPVHDTFATGSRPAGWTPDGRLVFQLDGRVTRVAPGGSADLWPGLTGGEIPNTMLEDSLVVHRIDAATKQTIVERVSDRGKRREVHRMPLVDARYVVRCAGDRAKPCFIEELDAGQREVTWRLFYPFTGEVGRVLHKRLRRQRNMQTAALSLDGKTLAIVEGTSELILVDTETSSVRTVEAGTGVELQTIGFGGDGSLWATAMGYRGSFFALLKFPSRGGRIANEPTDVSHGPSRFFWRPTPSHDDKHLAVGLIDFHLEAWRVSGL